MKISIVLNKSLSHGEKANCTAILMGQLAVCVPEIYDTAPVRDDKGILHASIKNNVIVLETSANKVQHLPESLHDIRYIVFTDVGQSYSNSYDIYKSDIEQGKTPYQIQGIVLYGNKDDINSVTKKFSLYK